MDMLTTILSGLTLLGVGLFNLYLKNKDKNLGIDIALIKNDVVNIKNDLKDNTGYHMLLNEKMETITKLVDDSIFSDKLNGIMTSVLEYVWKNDGQLLQFLQSERDVTDDFYHEIVCNDIHTIKDEFIEKLFARCVANVTQSAYCFDEEFKDQFWDGLIVRAEDYKANVVALIREEFNGKKQQLQILTQQYLFDQMKFVTVERDRYLTSNKK